MAHDEASWLAGDLLPRAASLGASTLHEAAGRIGALPSALRPLHPDQAAASGPALTVLCPGGDNLRLHQAIYAANPGDMLVVEVGAGEDYGYWGEIMAAAAQHRRIAGLVLAGGVRDSEQMKRMGFPVWCTTLCIRGTGKDPERAGAIGGRIQIGDVTVSRGDLVVADADGVVVLARDAAARTVDAGEQRERTEADVLRRLRDGETTLDIFGLRRPESRTRPPG